MRAAVYTGLFLLGIVLLQNCSSPGNTLFTKLPASKTGINFRNMLQESNELFNIMTYPYFYNGAGVAVGDINNDGLVDVCFTGNMVKNRLYVNKGNFRFEDITDKAGIASKEGWCTGVTMADINEDGHLDIYICRSGLSNINYRTNLLFINNGDLTFTEKAAEYGLDDAGYSTQASFFDYDKDDDLDCFLINQSTPDYSKANLEYAQLRNKKADSLLANKLFRNDRGHFVDISAQAGISSNVLTFSLGISTADINMDGWPDIYVANDFNEHDYYYINNQDGTFKESLKQMLNHTSQYSMGMDVADYNNDLLPDICVLDMLPENNHDLKMHVGADNYDKFNLLFSQGYYFQYMKNTLQKNNGDGTFSEIGQLAGIAATDWSWSPLLADYDNDGYRDLFITNGYKRDNTNMQFLKYSIDQSIRIQQGEAPLRVEEYISKMPGIYLNNYIYRNKGNEQFENKIVEWGFDEKTFSHGAVYADLDNDGDLDIVTNNTEDYAGIYRNNAEKGSPQQQISIILKGTNANRAAIGAKVFLYNGKQQWYAEQNPVKGFQSASDTRLHVGLGNNTNLDSIRIVWPNDATQVFTNVSAGKSFVADIKTATEKYIYTHVPVSSLLKPVTDALSYTHTENYENDFTRQFLLPHFYSHSGPCMIKGDVNGDGREDIFVGGAKGIGASLFLQTPDGKFKPGNLIPFVADAASEDKDAAFFDADGDGDIDLYVASGGYEIETGSMLLQDRLYFNDGKGNFVKRADALPAYLANKSCVKPADIDADGDYDLFIGGHVKPARYPYHEPSKILLNGGKGNFTDFSDQYPVLSELGLVTDAAWIDINKDKQNDLVVAGEWMHPALLENNKGKLSRSVLNDKIAGLTGLWNKMLAADFDEDGDMDFVIGNYGLNSILKASVEKPVDMYALDIDGNGSVDPVIAHYVSGISYPFVAMDDIIGQVPSFKKKFYEYEAYANTKMTDVLTEEQMKQIPPGGRQFCYCLFGKYW